MLTMRCARSVHLAIMSLLVIVIVYTSHKNGAASADATLRMKRSDGKPSAVRPNSLSHELCSKGMVDSCTLARIDRSVPRGQAFFYTTAESERLGSFETWRPRHLVRRNTRSINHFQGDDNIFVAMQTCTSSMWRRVPMQLLTTFQDFKSFGIYGNAADSIGGVEIIDVLSKIDRSFANRLEQLEAYSLIRTVRDKHVIIPDMSSIPGIEKLARFQTLAMVHQVYRDHPEHDWYVIVDDQVSVFQSNLRAFLRGLDASKPYYLGRALKGRDIIYASLESGIILSRGTMNLMFEKASTVRGLEHLIYQEYMTKAQHECCGDYMLAKYLRDECNLEINLEISGDLFQVDSLAGLKVRARNWCSPVATIGGQRLRDMEVLAEYVQYKDSNQIVFSDIYLDFVKPYLDGTRVINWDNGSNDLEFSPMESHSSDAHESLELCRQKCEEMQQCLMFRYDSYLHYCGIGLSSVALGGPILQYESGMDTKKCTKYGIQCQARKADEFMASEWKIERIREMRKSIECDTLAADPFSEGSEHGSLDQVEGWWHRATSKATR